MTDSDPGPHRRVSFGILLGAAACALAIVAIVVALTRTSPDSARASADPSPTLPPRTTVVTVTPAPATARVTVTVHGTRPGTKSSTPSTATPSQQPAPTLDCEVLSFGPSTLQFEVSPGTRHYSGYARVTLVESNRGITFPVTPTVRVHRYDSTGNVHDVPQDDQGASAEPDSCTAIALG